MSGPRHVAGQQRLSQPWMPVDHERSRRDLFAKGSLIRTDFVIEVLLDWAYARDNSREPEQAAAARVIAKDLADGTLTLVDKAALPLPYDPNYCGGDPGDSRNVHAPHKRVGDPEGRYCPGRP